MTSDNWTCKLPVVLQRHCFSFLGKNVFAVFTICKAWHLSSRDRNLLFEALYRTELHGEEPLASIDDNKKTWQLRYTELVRTAFPNSVLLSANHDRLLSKWYGSFALWKLCYRASRDGYNRKAFHDRCDD